MENLFWSRLNACIRNHFNGTPTTSTELPQRVTEIFRQFQATSFSVRARAMANQIARKKPDIIGLQEAAK